jgi:16S rRNA (uracil1498-N3)-methyltransferase
MHRFYLPDFQQPVLSETEAHHGRTVLRLRSGDEVTAFDGRGHEARCEWGEAGRLKILEQSTTPPRHCRITLAQAVPKKNMDFIVQKATELGVAAIIPLISERTVKKPGSAPERWREIALESCKQCGNNWLPELSPPQPLRAFLDAPGRFDLMLIGSLQPDARPLKKILVDAPALRCSNPVRVLVMIGPEGDFTPAELAAAESAGCRALSLGSLVLRADTAAVYALSVLHHELENG